MILLPDDELERGRSGASRRPRDHEVAIRMAERVIWIMTAAGVFGLIVLMAMR